MKHLYLLSLSLFFLLTGCNQPKQYYEVTGMLHTPYQIKFEYKSVLNFNATTIALIRSILPPSSPR